MKDMNYWLEPEKITESFVWYCFSKLNESEIQDHIIGYRKVFGDELREEIKNRKPLKEHLKKDEESVERYNDEVEMEVVKSDKIWINKMVKKLGFAKDDYKNIIRSVMKEIQDHDK